MGITITRTESKSCRALRVLGRPMSSALRRQIGQLRKQYDKLQKRLKPCSDDDKQQSLKALIEENTAQQQVNRKCALGG